MQNVATSNTFPQELPQGLRYIKYTSGYGVTQNEDCLTLNVWTKPLSSQAKKAVIVYVYGGGFDGGFSNNVLISGEYLADTEDVIVVTFNYRINIFGFPGLPPFEQNAGLLDQRLAIEWVRDNIEAFGGDPTRIVIDGQSAGAASVDIYSYAWVDDPIVSGFIAQSGTATSFYSGSLPGNNTAMWYQVSSQLGCGGQEQGLKATRECVQSKDALEILRYIPLASSGVGVFSPTIDDQVVFGDYADRALQGNFIKKVV